MPPGPSSPTSQGKICVVCGKDCSAIDRIKDAEGRYTCKPCADAKSGKAAKPSSPSSDKAIASLYDRSDDRTCPQCDKPVPGDAEICVACGYNLRSGKPVKTRLGKLDPASAAAMEQAAKARAKASRWVLATSVAGVLGAGAWAALTFFMADPYPYAASVVGLLCGAAVAFAARDHFAAKSTLIACGLALLFMLLGKGGSATIMAYAHGPKASEPVVVNDAFAKVLFAKETAKTVGESFASAGKTLYWPTGYSVENARQQEHFPPEVWQEASKRWEESGPGWQQQYAKTKQENLQFEADNKLDADRKAVLLASFNWWDLAWGGLGLALAGALGAGAHQLVRRS